MSNTTSITTPVLDDETVAAFERDGVVVLRQVFNPWIDELAKGVEQLMADPSPLERSVQPSDGSAPFFQDLCNWPRIPSFRNFIYHSPAGALAARIMGSSSARFFHDHVLVKRPGGSTVTPWHQDQPYYCTEGRQSVSFWIPLDPVSEDVVMKCVRGSHRWGRDFRPMRFDGTRLYDNDEYAALPDIDADPASFDIAAWDMQPGDAIAFNFRTVHGAPANQSPRMRRVFSARWVGDDATYFDRQGKGSPPLRPALAHGAPLHDPMFPLVWQGGAAVPPAA